MNARIATARRWLADKVLGNQTVMFSSRENLDRMECGDYLGLPDDVLGVATRRWFTAIELAHVKDAAEADKPVGVMTAQHAVLALATYARRMNADTADFSVSGSIDGGKTEGVFRVTFSNLPDDHRLDGPAVEKVVSPDDPEKITSLTLRFDNPAYDRWKAKRLASADTHPKDGDGEAAPLVSGAVPSVETADARKDAKCQ